MIWMRAFEWFEDYAARRRWPAVPQSSVRGCFPVLIPQCVVVCCVSIFDFFKQFALVTFEHCSLVRLLPRNIFRQPAPPFFHSLRERTSGTKKRWEYWVRLSCLRLSTDEVEHGFGRCRRIGKVPYMLHKTTVLRYTRSSANI